jgi:hypothetical protein
MVPTTATLLVALAAVHSSSPSSPHQQCDKVTIHHTSGCFNVSSAPVLPHSIPTLPRELTLEVCAAACYTVNLTAAGVTNGDTCFCGSPTDLETASAKSESVPKSECTGTPCAGDPAETECGGPSRLLAFMYSCSTAPPPPTPPAPPTPPSPCTGPYCFTFSYDVASGTAATTLPTANFSVRKLEAIYYPPDKRTYAYVDIVNYSDFYYPASYVVSSIESPLRLDAWWRCTRAAMISTRAPPPYLSGGATSLNCLLISIPTSQVLC